MNSPSIEYWQTAQEVIEQKSLWDELYSRSDASPFLSHEYFTTALKYFLGNNLLRVGVVKVDGNPVAIVPLEISEKKFRVFSLRVLCFAFEGWPLRNGAIVPDRDNHLFYLTTVVNDLSKSHPEWHYCHLHKLPESIIRDGKNAGIGPLTNRFESVILGSSVVIDVPPTWEDYRKALSNAQRKGISRHLNAFEREGRVRFARFGPNAHLDEDYLDILIKDAVAVSRNSWQHRSTKGWSISDPQTGGFFVEVSKKYAASGMLDLSVLYLNDKPVSFIWGAARWPHALINKLGFDQAYEALSPGFVHLAKYIADSTERSITDIDFGYEFFDYKSRWGKHFDVLVDLHFYPPGFMPSGIRWLRSIKHLCNQGSNGRIGADKTTALQEQPLT